MTKPIAIKPLDAFRLWLRYSDGIEGIVDLGEFAGRGVFEIWNDYRNFERVRIESDGAIAWTDDVEMCPDALYLKITGKTPEELFPKLRELRAHAGNQPVLRNSH
jgi:hypothetical protein